MTDQPDAPFTYAHRPGPQAARMLRYFAWEHLPPYLQRYSRPFADLAHELATYLPEAPETTMALRKLLEAKDCAVRSALDIPDDGPDIQPPAP
jgi:hypothetical protein